MPQAQGTPCSVCGTLACKYTCPYCDAVSCSLPCFKTHKADRVCASAREALERRTAIGAPTSLLARGARDPSRYVPMRDYDYGQMVQDYQFLSQVGSVVTRAGRTLADAKMVPEPAKQGSTPRRLPAAQHRRERLSKQIGFQKLPVMLLPDGMSKRQQNKTSYDPKYVGLLTQKTHAGLHSAVCVPFSREGWERGAGECLCSYAGRRHGHWRMPGQGT